MIRIRAISYSLLEGDRIVYFDALEQSNPKQIDGYTSNKHKTKAQKALRQNVGRYDACSNVMDANREYIYDNDILETTYLADGEWQKSHNQVFLSGGAFYVDISYSQSRSSMDLLSRYVKDNKCVIIGQQ